MHAIFIYATTKPRCPSRAPFVHRLLGGFGTKETTRWFATRDGLGSCWGKMAYGWSNASGLRFVVIRELCRLSLNRCFCDGHFSTTLHHKMRGIRPCLPPSVCALLAPTINSDSRRDGTSIPGADQDATAGRGANCALRLFPHVAFIYYFGL